MFNIAIDSFTCKRCLNSFSSIRGWIWFKCSYTCCPTGLLLFLVYTYVIWRFLKFQESSNRGLFNQIICAISCNLYLSYLFSISFSWLCVLPICLLSWLSCCPFTRLVLIVLWWRSSIICHLIHTFSNYLQNFIFK